MKVSELCRMIEESIHAEKYPLEDQEVRIQNLFVLNNYVPDIEHLPGIIEMDILDSFKILSRRIGRISSDLITNL